MNERLLVPVSGTLSSLERDKIRIKLFLFFLSVSVSILVLPSLI